MDEDADYGLCVKDIRRKVMEAFCPERNESSARIRAEVAERRTGAGRGAVHGHSGCGHSGHGHSGHGRSGRGHSGHGRGCSGCRHGHGHGRHGHGGDGTEAGEAGADRNNERNTLLHPINVQEMVDGQVDDAVNDKYLNEVLVFGD
jgi:hypothetical protein